MSRILIVDDSELLLRTAKTYLSRQGHEITVAQNLAAAKAALATDLDLVVTDANMPGGSGLDLLRWLQDERPDVRAILMSGALGGIIKDQAKQFGVHHILAKPFTLPELGEAIDRVLAD